MIVRDEAHLLPACLQAALALSDDFCIIDTGSKDNTAAIARQMGARVKEHLWQGDFALARNESLRMARRPWVLVLDADEQICKEAIEAIHGQISREKVGALSLSIHDAQPDNSVRISRVLRAWRHNKNMVYRHRIHEDISWAVFPWLRSAHKKLVHIPHPIVHLGYTSAEMARKNKHQRDQEILWRCIREDAGDIYSWFKLLELGHHKKDIQLCHRVAGRIHALMRQQPLANYAHFLGDLSRYLDSEAQKRGVPIDQRLSWLRHWSRISPDEPTLATLEGQLCEQQGDFTHAKAAFERALDGNSLRPNVQMMHIRPLLGLARLAMAQGELQKSLQLARRAHKLAPDDREARVAIAGLEQLCG